MISNPSEWVERVTRAGSRHVFAVLFIFFHLLTRLQMPVDIAGNELDASWHIVLNHAHEKDFTFGRDISFTYGPSGYLISSFFFEDTFSSQILFQLALHLVGGLLLWHALKKCAAWPLRLLLLAGLFCFSLPADAIIPVYLCAAAFHLFSSLHERRPLRWPLIGSFLLFLLTGTLKFTILIICGAFIGCILLHLFLVPRRYWRHHFVAAGSLVIAVLASWLVHGQSLAAFFRFTFDGIALSSGYSDAMAIETPPSPGILLFLFFALSLLFAASRLLQQWRKTIAPVLFLAFVLFMLWKHSIVRSDFSHLFILPGAGFLIVVLLIAVTQRLEKHSNVLISGLVLLLWMNWIIASQTEKRPGIATALVSQSQNIAHLSQLGETMEKTAREWRKKRREAQLPKFREIIGRGEVDVFGDLQGAAVLNSLRYRPRPLFQSYATYHPRLIDRNETYYLSEKAPPFVMATLTDLDDRFPALSDAKALRALFTSYQAVEYEAPYLLMHKDGRAPKSQPSFLSETVASNGQEVPIPDAAPGHGIWVEIEVHGGIGRKLRSLASKSETYQLHLRSTDLEIGQNRFRLPTSCARAGFLLSPFLSTTPDLALLRERPDALAAVRSISVDGPESSVSFRFHSIPLPMPGEGRIEISDVFSGVLGVHVAKTEGRVFCAKVKDQLGLTLTGQSKMVVTAPGSSKMTGLVSVDKWGYKFNGKKGTVRVTATAPDGDLLWERELDPARRSADRELVPFVIAFPENFSGPISFGLETNGTLNQAFLADLTFTP